MASLNISSLVSDIDDLHYLRVVMSQFKDIDILAINETKLDATDNKLQFKSPIRYSSKFSASILSIILSKVEKRSGDDCGVLYQVDTREGFDPGLEISAVRLSRLFGLRSARS